MCVQSSLVAGLLQNIQAAETFPALIENLDLLEEKLTSTINAIATTEFNKHCKKAYSNEIRTKIEATVYQLKLMNTNGASLAELKKFVKEYSQMIGTLECEVQKRLQQQHIQQKSQTTLYAKFEQVVSEVKSATVKVFAVKPTQVSYTFSDYPKTMSCLRKTKAKNSVIIPRQTGVFLEASLRLDERTVTPSELEDIVAGSVSFYDRLHRWESHPRDLTKICTILEEGLKECAVETKISE